MCDDAPNEALAFLQAGGRRLGDTLDLTADGRLAARYALERGAWDCFFETLNRLDHDLAAGDPFARRLRRRTRALVDAVSLESR